MHLLFCCSHSVSSPQLSWNSASVSFEPFEVRNHPQQQSDLLFNGTSCYWFLIFQEVSDCLLLSILIKKKKELSQFKQTLMNSSCLIQVWLRCLSEPNLIVLLADHDIVHFCTVARESLSDIVYWLYCFACCQHHLEFVWQIFYLKAFIFCMRLEL